MNVYLLNDIKNLTVESIVYCNGYEYSITAKKQALEVLEDNERKNKQLALLFYVLL